MTKNDKPDADEQYEKVKDGLGPDKKSSYAPADTSAERVKEKAEHVRREIREDRHRAEGDG